MIYYMALPEVPKSTPPVPVLPFTGAPTLWQLGAGVTLVGIGGLLLVVGRRRKKTTEPVPSTTDS
jgi:LPXTG-motif cell wall-anchored protein